MPKIIQESDASNSTPAHSLKCLEQLQHGGKHYKDDGVQPIMYGQMNAMKPMEYSAIKYISRHHQKGKAEDLKKAIHFLQMALEYEYGVIADVQYSEK